MDNIDKKFDKRKLQPLLEGFCRAIILWFILEYWSSIYADKSYSVDVTVIVSLTLISAAISVLLLKTAKAVIRSYVFSILAFILTSAVFFALDIAPPDVRILPLRELSNADGLILLAASAFYIASTALVRFVLVLIRVHRAHTKKSENGSVS